MATTGQGGAENAGENAAYRYQAGFVPQEVLDLTNKGIGGTEFSRRLCLPPFFPAPPAQPSVSSAPRPRAKEFSFPLDGFQEAAIQCVERGESVLVAAHTSAGKTVCADFAIAKAIKEGQKVIYTCPIKALSNQKYGEWSEEFLVGRQLVRLEIAFELLRFEPGIVCACSQDDAGLMTGDVTINPSAGLLVMTTEVLRDMLYRGAEVSTFLNLNANLLGQPSRGR